MFLLEPNNEEIALKPGDSARIEKQGNVFLLSFSRECDRIIMQGPRRDSDFKRVMPGKSMDEALNVAFFLFRMLGLLGSLDQRGEGYVVFKFIE